MSVANGRDFTVIVLVDPKNVDGHNNINIFGTLP